MFQAGALAVVGKGAVCYGLDFLCLLEVWWLGVGECLLKMKSLSTAFAMMTNVEKEKQYNKLGEHDQG